MDGTTETKKVSPADIMEAVKQLDARLVEITSPQVDEAAVRKDQIRRDFASFQSLISHYFGPGRPLLTLAVHEKGHTVIRPELLLEGDNGAMRFALRPSGGDVQVQSEALRLSSGMQPQRLLDLQLRFLRRAMGETGGSTLRPQGLSDGTRLDAPDPDTFPPRT